MNNYGFRKVEKRISKKAKMGCHGYPTPEIRYLGPNNKLANEVLIKFILEEVAALLIERFTASNDIPEDETIQSAIVKMMERSATQTVILTGDVKLAG